jgi:arsenite/tail-anchored protein-transporting ATPase
VAGLTFFVGKGGVGKTTVSAAYAVHRASQRGRGPVLLMSTDPAHSLADVFERRLGPKPQRLGLDGSAQLALWQVDAQRQFRKFLDRYREPIILLLESGTMFSRAEIEPLLDSTLPGMAEMAALLAIHETLAGGKFSELVVDTAPIGHTLRLFEMPEYFARFLDLLELAGNRDVVLAEHFGGMRIASNPFIAEWRNMVATVQKALHQPESRVIMVTTPEEFALNESLRTAQAMAHAADPLHVTDIVINRAVRRAGRCPVCKERQKRTQAALQFVQRHFPRLSLHIAEAHGGPVLGWRQLHGFGAHIYAGKPLRLTVKAPATAREAKLVPAQWPALKTRVSWTTGKGGVGKTTLSAALALNQRRLFRSQAVTICSTDPAPSLDDVFQKDVADQPVPVLRDPKLRAVEMDAAAAFRAWADEMKSKLNDAFTSELRGLHVDLSFERRILTALLDMVPPGVDEITAIFRILDLLGDSATRQWLIVDMAPTGHALELLRMPERILRWSRLLLKSLAPHRKMALAREVAVQVATLSHRVRELASRLKDVRSSQVIPVMLAEPLPDRETIRLLHSLDDLGVPTSVLFVNRVLFRDDACRCRRCADARQWQMATLSELRRRHREKQIYVVRDRAREIAGGAALESLIGELWQIV